MKVRLYAANQETGSQVFERECYLQDLYPELGDEYNEIADEISKAGRAWIGGGASQLFLACKA